MPDIGLQATMQELGMSIDGWEQWNDTSKPLIDPAMLFLDLDALGATPTTAIEPPPAINPNQALPKSKFAAARASHLLSIPSAPALDFPSLETPKPEPLSAAEDIAQRILARTLPPTYTGLHARHRYAQSSSCSKGQRQPQPSSNRP
ncbi:hypothetical protein RSAG8_02933, partial [Rhizoctonia solani AG-8 WAC10335]